MFEYYLPNKNEGATVAPKSKFCELNKGLVVLEPSAGSLLSAASCYRVLPRTWAPRHDGRLRLPRRIDEFSRSSTEVAV